LATLQGEEPLNWHQRWVPGGMWAQIRKPFYSVVLFSAVANLLLLTAPLFMLQIYDRVLTSHSIPTLLALTLLAVVLIGFFALLDMVRQRVLARIGLQVHGKLAAPVFQRAIDLGDGTPAQRGSDQPLADLNMVRQWLAGSGPVAILDLPWLPLYLLIIFLLHVWLGVVATIGALVMLVLAALNEIVVRGSVVKAREPGQKSQMTARMSARNDEAVRAMGMVGALSSRWQRQQVSAQEHQLRGDDGAAGFSAAIKATRLLLQIILLAFGGYLVIASEMTAGAMIAASIIGARALAPVEAAASQWRQMIEMRSATARLNALLSGGPKVPPVQLPSPAKSLSLEKMTVIPPGATKPTLRQISMTLQAGQGLSVVGACASGKSTLARALVGIWPAAMGTIRLDGATLEQWSAADHGQHMGYLPQDVQLFDGTVAENIARFEERTDDVDVVKAAQLAGAHDQIVRLSEGYNTRIGDGGMLLSAGQRQVIGLARALYRMPFLIVLDEPNANLDAAGEGALVRAIRAAREQGSIVVVMAHRPSVVAATDMTLMLAEGRVQAFGPRDAVLKKVLAPVGGKKVAAE
jgi:PrtD family type I secretion system ABC transporter